jgi:putative two-component system response regulator
MPLNIVVADDDRVALDMVCDALVTAKHSVRLATDGRQAKQLIREFRPNVVLTDWNMPECDGIELCRWIREHYSTPYVYVVVATTRDSAGDAVEALAAGADEFLRKPVDSAEVIARVRAAERILMMESRHLTILALAKLAESRDPETGGHLERVSRYVRLLHEILAARGSPYADEVEMLDPEMFALAATLHDVGKVGIPDSILLKPGRLSDEEYQMMKQHTEIGANALASAMQTSRGADFLQVAHDIVLSHHERFDGQGYPNGLAGEDVPLVGRIVGLVDVYDALTSTRVYRGAMLHSAAHEIIVRERGRQFDPVVVDAYLSREGDFRKTQEALAR